MNISINIKDLENVIKQAGDILNSYYLKPLKVKIKEDKSYVTEADLESEKFLMENLVKLLPSCSFWTEESGKVGENDYCWVIDPLDGTANFARGIPYFCISVALTYQNNPIIGVVYDPLRSEFFYSQKGKGAFLNGESIYISKRNSLNECLVVTNFPSNKHEDFKNNWKRIENIRSKSFTMRLMGASALDQVYAACGRYDSAFFNYLKWWDIAAGMLIIEEAGGIVSDCKREKITPEFNTYVAASPIIYDQLIKELNIY